MTNEDETQNTNVIRFPVVPRTNEEPIRYFNSDRARISLLEWAQRIEADKDNGLRDAYEVACEAGMLAWCTELMKVNEEAFIDAVAELNMIMQDSCDVEEEDT